MSSEKPRNESLTPSQVEKLHQALEVIQTINEFEALSLTPFFMSSIADELGIKPEQGEEWNRESFFDAMDKFDRDNARKKAQLVGEVFGDMFETLSEVEEESLEGISDVIHVLGSEFKNVADFLEENPNAVETIFSEDRPFNFNWTDTWRSAGYISHVAHLYKRHSGSENTVGWLTKYSQPNDQRGIEQGLMKLHSEYLRGDFDF